MIRIQTTNQIDLDAIHVTANLGVHYGLLARWFGDVVEREPRFRDAHWVRRLGNLIGSGNDQWWVLVGDRGAATPPDPIVAPGQISDFVEAVASLGQSTITAHLDHDLVRGEWGRGDDWAIGSVRARLNAAIMAADVGDFNVARPLLDDLRADVQVVPELAPVLARLERHAVGQNGAP